jgi:hypothetical protein
VKTRALRLKVWFKALSKTERAIMDLTLKCVERVRSHLLEATIWNIINKILRALDLRFLVTAEKVGREIAKQLSLIAERWGNKEASTWKLDIGFVRFLGISSVNQ